MQWDDKKVFLANREADVAFRQVENPSDSLAGRRVARVYRSAYASSEYLFSHDPVNDPQSCFWLGWGNSSTQLEWTAKMNFPADPVGGELYSNVLHLAAVQDNMGIASLPCFIGDAAPGVQRIPNATATPGDWIWVLAHKDMASNARVRTLIRRH